MCCVFYVLCYVSRPQIHLFLLMLKYVLPYKCNCIMISDTFNFFKHLKIARLAGGPCIFLMHIDLLDEFSSSHVHNKQQYKSQ